MMIVFLVVVLRLNVPFLSSEKDEIHQIVVDFHKNHPEGTEFTCEADCGLLAQHDGLLDVAFDEAQCVYYCHE